MKDSTLFFQFSRLVAALACAAVLLATTACTHTAETLGSAAGAAAAKSAVPELASSLDELSSPQSQKKLEVFLQSPAVRNFARELGSQLTLGAAQQTGLILSPNAPGEVSGRSAATSDLRRQIDSLISEVVDSAVNQATIAATQPPLRKAIDATSEEAGENFSIGIARAGPAVAEMTRDRAGPAFTEGLFAAMGGLFTGPGQSQFFQLLHRALQEEIVPAVVDIWKQGDVNTLQIPAEPKMSPLVIANTENIARGNFLGTSDELQRSGALSQLDSVDRDARIAIWAIISVLGLIGLGLIGATIMLLLIYISLRRENRVNH